MVFYIGAENHMEDAEFHFRTSARPFANTSSSEEAGDDYDYHEEPCARWHLVWCHERCRKQDARELHDALGGLAHRAGGRFFCVKKAKSYGAWRTRVEGRAPHVLLTDGREIKPCMQAMAASARYPSALLNRPLLIVVLAEQQRPFERVVSWTRNLRADGDSEPVHVIRSLGELGPLLMNVLPHLAHPCNSLASHCALSQRWEVAHQEGDAAAAGSLPFLSVDGHRLPLCVRGWLSSVCPGRSAAEVEQMLKAAMHQLYED